MPNDGQYCQPITELTTPPPPTEYMAEIEIDTLDAAALNQLRTLLKNLSLPFGVSEVQITELNITTDITCPTPTVPPTPADYMVEIEIDTVDAAVLNQLRTLLKNLSLPFGISDVQVTELNITTVCLLNDTGYQCRCEDQYFWPCNKCAAYGPCDNINNVTCGCIRAVPNDGQFCQPMTELTNITPCPTPSPTGPPTEYVVEIEIDTVDAAVLTQLRTLLKNLSLPFGISDVQVTELNITTVCLLNDTGYQCRCEDQYFWPCNKCAAYGPCDNINNVTCGCIRAVPNDGQFCQPMTELTSPPTEYVVEIEIDTVDAAVLTQLRTLLKNLSLPFGISDVQVTELNITTGPPTEYVVEIEIDTVDAAVLTQLRTLLKNLSLPFGISDVQVTEVNITTVCLLNDTGYQCRCEDQYFWPCNKCAAYGPCDNINNVTCGCIRAVPNDGQFCQPMTELTSPSTEYVVEIEIDTVDAAVLTQLRTLLKNLSLPFGISDVQITEVNITTAPSSPTEYVVEIEIDTVDAAVLNQLRTLLKNLSLPFGISDVQITEVNITTAPSSPTEYVVEIEIDTVDAAVLTQLRTLLKNLSLPFGISDVQITEVNITTVCLLNNTGYQCRCEDQYFWPCNKCAAYGPCDNINNVTCGCIRAVPNDGQFCQPMTELTNISACPTPSPTAPSSPTEYVVEIEIDTVDAAVLTQLRTLLKNLSLPFGISDVQITEVNITTAPSSPTEYVVEIEIDTVDAAVLTQLRTLLKNLSLPFGISDVQITEVNITTAPSSPTEYVVEIEIDTVDAAVLNQLRTLLKNLSLPFGISDVQITELNITTVCLLNDTGYQCRCEDQYFWPCNKCAAYGPCDNINNVTCGCITAVPNDGQFCQPMTELTNFTACPISSPTGTSTPNMTTETSAPKTTIKITAPVPTTGVIVPVPITVVSTSTTATPAEYTITLSMTIDKTFDNTLTDKNSQMYQQYSKDITSAVDDAYSGKLSLYKAGSTKVIQFRPGSVVADFTIASTSNTLDFSVANRQLASALRDKGYSVNENSFAQTVESGLYDPSKGNIYPGKDLVLTCNPPALSTGGIIWSFNDYSLGPSTDGKTLTVKSTSDRDSGKYACKTTLNSIPYIIWQRIVIQPLPNIRVTTSKTVYCDGSPITLECCAENSYMTKWSLFTSSGLQKLTELKTGCSTYPYPGFSEAACKDQIMTFLWEVYDLNGNLYSSNNVTITVTGKRMACYNAQYGAGELGDLQTSPCDADSIGTVTARCISNTTGSGVWNVVESTCILRVLQELVDKSKNLQVADVPQFTADLRNATESNSAKIANSELNILTVVQLMAVIANVSESFIVDKSIMTIIVWKPLTRNDTAYMRHVSIVNIALSLLIADICFIIAAAIVKEGEPTPVGSCSTATFFMHFFYLALFFWMLFSALLLLYRTIMVFARMSKSIMLAIAFSVGYGCPLLIAVITVAVTAGGGGYIQEMRVCWLNWFKTKALLAFVIPALTIVLINLLVLVVVLFKMIRRGVGNVSQPDEKHPLMMIAKCVAILTPLFGLTWGFGIGTMVTPALGIHIVFALLNSLQGFFVLVFGILLDSKIRKALAERLKLQNLKNLTFSRTRSTSAGPSSSGLRGGRNGYNVSSGSGSSAVSSSSISDTVTNT
ncbi:hypothetical protein SRHO_G00070530 [Serrasalmus rhombeus]